MARAPSLPRIYSRRLGPVVETRFSFLLTAAAVTPSKRMQFHPSAQLFAYERKIRGGVVARARATAFAGGKAAGKLQIDEGAALSV